ncbi:DUF6625 family protein [Candidatus Stoquefichus massiliensis]|uniref:DUF6625 family protein n=1 Tax=Candidatus Stoquefichus massiliensis TaxID=1470350 RepID=UPI0004B5BAE6|nr:DUF6625 family protein [Candidatus Stoquefichus massiliensis]
MNKIAFIIPYYGKFNNYFNLFLASCEKNKDICDWIIFTDDKSEYRYPSNVKVYYNNWTDMQNLIKIKLNNSFSCSRPYKLCDYKVAYGYIFSDYLTEYDYWGYCDVDLIWGNIATFIKKINMDIYDKIFDLGHCTLYRNEDKVNTAFMLTLNGRSRFNEVFSDEKNCSFDEEYNDSINCIFLEHNLKIFNESFAANTYMKTSNFRLTKMNSNYKYYVEKNFQNLFLWDNGNLYRFYCNNKKLIKLEFMYIHLQSRSMKVNIDCNDLNKKYKIIPNSFDYLEYNDVTQDNFNRIKKKHFNLHYFKLRSKNLKIKIGRLIK